MDETIRSPGNLDPWTDRYLQGAQLDLHLPELRALAGQLAEQIHTDQFTYVPKRARGSRQISAQGWSARLNAYEWPYGTSFISASGQVEELSANLAPITRKIDADLRLTGDEEAELRAVAGRVFQWGGVTRGASKQDASAQTIISVIHSGLRWQHVGEAPMDSGWTKIAALATGSMEQHGRTPQVINDSRVAHALIRNVERLLDRGTALGIPHGQLRHHLRQIPGRGGSRTEPYRLSWKSGYRTWNAQFFVSLLVRLMRDALNASPARFGAMPNWRGGVGPWTSRGVEMVLFMDGY